MQRSRCIAHPASIETHIDDRVLHFRQAPAVAIVEQETPLGTERVLTEITLGAAGRFAAFDDLITLTVRAADGDERHGPFLPMRSYEDEAQCDIHLSPSPLLKHYQVFHPVDLCNQFEEKPQLADFHGLFHDVHTIKVIDDDRLENEVTAVGVL